MRKVSFRERLRYAFDNFMGKGTIALIGMLFLITAIVVVITGVLSTIGNGDASAGNSIWMSLMHALDAGTLAGDDTSNIGFVILMTIVTICGIFVTSILIGIISSAFEDKLNSLRKGFSRVVENNHTVIVGFNDSIYTILTELIEANSNHKKSCIIVIGQEEKEVMDEEIQNHIDDFKTTRIICRSGKATNSAILEMASVETARSVIINEENDFTVIKSILALVAYMKAKNVFENEAYITALIHNRENFDAARIAGEGKAEIIFFKDMITRVIANTTRQPGLSTVLTEMFDFGGSEFYFEAFPELVGKKFGDVLNLFDLSVVVGLYKGEKPLLNPPMDTIIEEGDRIIHLAEDDGISKPMASAPGINAEACKAENIEVIQEPFSLLILGYNDSLTQLLGELSEFLTSDSKITIAVENLTAELADEWKQTNDNVAVVEKNIYDISGLQDLIHADTKNILLLAEDDCEKEEADEKILILLLQIRAILAKNNWKINITSEMNSVENQKLMQVADVNDFVVGSSITSLIMTQIAENRHLLEFFTTLLTSEGSEFYMKPAENYVKLNQKLNFFELTEIAKQKNEILMGYKKMIDGKMQLTIAPPKTEQVSFNEDDYLIVIAED